MSYSEEEEENIELDSLRRDKVWIFENKTNFDELESKLKNYGKNNFFT